MAHLLALASCCTECKPSPCDPCDATCCLYPPPGTSDARLYSADDLPDAVLVAEDRLTRQYGWYFIGESWQIAPKNDGSGWQVYPIGNNTANGGTSTCLVNLYTDYPDSPEVLDEFHDTYTVTRPDGTTVVVTRMDRCTWKGTGLTLFYDATVYKWTVNGQAKTSNQNTPVGSYAGGYSVA